MILKNRVKLYNIGKKELTYKEIISRINKNYPLYIKVLIKQEEVNYIRCPENATMRDIHMFVKGIEIANWDMKVEKGDIEI